MGDRGMIAIQYAEDAPRVYFYAHNTGYSLPEKVFTALRRRQRWDDPSYLARIIFSTLIADDVMSETGYGIVVEVPTDLNNPIIVVDTKNQQLWSENSRGGDRTQRLSFEQYIAAARVGWKLFK